MEPLTALRVDVWLDVACLFRTRSEAQRACRNRQVLVNGQPAKPHRDIRPGDELVIMRPLGRRQTVVVIGLASTHVPKAEARTLYADRTPPPTPEEVEMRRQERVFRATMVPAGRPDKRQRRSLRRAKGFDR
ncbi:MAG: S4 domain-containing protein [Acidobacteriota bacterium]